MFSLMFADMYYSETDDEDRSRENSREPSPCLSKAGLKSKKEVESGNASPNHQPYINMSSITQHRNYDREGQMSSSDFFADPVANALKDDQVNSNTLPKSMHISSNADKKAPETSSQSPYMNISFAQNRKERPSSVSSSTSTLNRPIPAKRNASAMNRSHTYMNIPPTSPSYKLSLQQRQAKAKLSSNKESGESIQAQSSNTAAKSTSLLNLNSIPPSSGKLDLDNPSSHCTHPYMNLPSPAKSQNMSTSQLSPVARPSSLAEAKTSSSYTSLPDTRARRSEFFGMLTEHCPPPATSCKGNKSRFGNKISASSTHLDRTGYDSSSRASSLDRKEMRDISPGLVARLAGSYNRLDKQELVENTPTTMSAVLSGKLKRRELSPGRVARMTDSFDSLGRGKKKQGHNRHCSTSSVSSNASSTSPSRGRLLYQRSLSASHSAVCKFSDLESQGKPITQSGANFLNSPVSIYFIFSQ